MIVLFFDRIYTGAPNITGRVGLRWYNWANGAFYTTYTGDGYSTSIWSGEDRRGDIDTSRISKEYSNINEVRVKSIISKGYIKLF